MSAGSGAVGASQTANAVDAAMRAAGVVWLSPDPTALGEDPLPPTTGPVWHVWEHGTCYLLTGPGEQRLPGIVPGHGCQVTVRDSVGGRVLTWPAAVRAIDPTDPTWVTVAPKLAAARLNGGDPLKVVSTWPGRLTILGLCPSGAPILAGSGLPDDGQAAPPLPSPAVTPFRRPADSTR